MDPRRCPAAHSMDTTWFAVDADGYVGVFRTGEDGALPTAAAAGPEGGEFDSWPIDALLAARALADGSFPAPFDDLRPPRYPTHAVLVLRPDPDEAATTYRDAAGRSYSVQDALGDDVFVLHDGEPRVVGSRRPLKPDVIARLAVDPRVERIVDDGEIADWSWDGAGPVYHYANTDYGNPGAYGRREPGGEPIDAASLPEDVQREVARLKLPVRFAEAPELHLADYFADEECVTWGATTLRGEPPDADDADGSPEAAPRSSSGAKPLHLAAIAIVIIALLYWILR